MNVCHGYACLIANSSIASYCRCRLQKMTDRKAALKKKAFKKQEDRKRWEKIFQTDMMSSEDSVEEEDEEILKVKPLTWRSEIVNRMMADLDVISKKDKSPQARRQQKTRKIGEASTRPPPQWAPTWTVKTM